MKKLNEIANRLYRNVRGLIFSSSSYYYIAEIDLSSRTIVFQVRNRPVFLKSSIDEAITNLGIINNLSPLDACWLGGHYGRMLWVALKKGGALKKVNNMSFLLKHNKGQYQITFQKRSGELGYYDKKNNIKYINDPVAIATDKSTITKFDPSEACYIGLLAGIRMEKVGVAYSGGVLKRPPTLRVVK